MKVLEEEGVIGYLKTRNITNPYLKAKHYIELGFFGQVDLRKREPKSEGIFYFKITKKFKKKVKPFTNTQIQSTPSILIKFHQPQR